MQLKQLWKEYTREGWINLPVKKMENCNRAVNKNFFFIPGDQTLVKESENSENDNNVTSNSLS